MHFDPCGSPSGSEEEEKLLRQIPLQEAALRTGRILDAVYSRRNALGQPPARRGPKPKRRCVEPAT
jgi:hypothetical protein